LGGFNNCHEANYSPFRISGERRAFGSGARQESYV
jgi:hypothetical protein